MIAALFLELFKILENGSCFDLPGVVLQHEQYISSDCYIHWMVSSEQDDGVILDGSYQVEVLLLVAIAQ